VIKLPGGDLSMANAINDAGQVVGQVYGPLNYVAPVGPSEPSSVPEPSTWAMMLIGFAGLGFAGYRRTLAG
jgi:hypothetical protein